MKEKSSGRMTKSGFCAFGENGHQYCVTECDCSCHEADVDKESDTK